MPQPTVLIVHASAHGHTERIVRRVAAVLDAGGVRTRIADAHAAHEIDPGPFAGFVVAAPVHHGHHPGEVAAWLTSHRLTIDRGPSLLLSVSLAAASAAEADRGEARRRLEELIVHSNVNPALSACVAGAVDYGAVSAIARTGLRAEAARYGLSTDVHRDTDYTDWDAVDDLAAALLRLLDPAGPAGPRSSHGAGVGLGTLRNEDVAGSRSEVPPALPALSAGRARVTFEHLEDRARLERIADGIRTIPEVGGVELDAVSGARAVLAVTLEGPIALAEELRARLADEIEACHEVDGRIDVDLLPDPGRRPAGRRATSGR